MGGHRSSVEMVYFVYQTQTRGIGINYKALLLQETKLPTVVELVKETESSWFPGAEGVR